MMFIFIKGRAGRCLPYAFAVLAACRSSDDPRTSEESGGSGGMAGHSHGTGSRGGANAAGGGGEGTGAAVGGGAAGSGGAAGGGAVSGMTGGGQAGAGGAGGDSGVPLLNGCTSYVDRTLDSAPRALLWVDEIAYVPERCMKIRVGQSVAFSGDFVEHPIAPLRGDTPNPITGPSPVFPNAGVFGYFCTTHPEMTGAIWVVD